MIDESGRMRPGVMSRSVAMRVAGLPELAHDRQRAATTRLVDARRTAPRLLALGRPLERQQRLELLGGPLALAGLDQVGVDQVAQLDQHLDVEGGVDEPRIGQRTGRPVGGGELLGQAEPEVVLDERGEADAREVEQSPGELGVEQRLGIEADLGEAHEVLRRGVQDPLVAVEGGVER